MKSPLVHPSYYEIQRGCSILARQILDKKAVHRPVSMIVALSRGGLIPGVELSHLLDLPLTPVCYSAKKGHGDNRNHLNVLPILPITPYTTIVLVDDIADSGQTLNEVQEYYSKDLIVETAVLYWKKTSVHTPNYYWKELEADSPWVEFPWEL